MKKIVSSIFVFVLLLSFAHGRTLTEKEARQLLEKAFGYLKTSDTSSFVNLWFLDNSIPPYHKRPYTKQDIIGDFNQMKEFLDTALMQSLKFDHVNVETEKPLSDEVSDAYKIKAWFMYNQHYFKGFGFYVEYRNNKWVVRYSPDTSTMWRDYK